MTNSQEVTVGRVDGQWDRRHFNTVREAEEYIASIAIWDKTGVERGDYYIDSPEEFVNGMIDKDGDPITEGV